MMSSQSYFWGTGRRKNAVARVRVRNGEGKILINNREMEDYFPRYQWRIHILEPLKASGLENKVDVLVRAHGGGLTGQSGAVRLGIARALLRLNPELRPTLKKAGYLSRDSRMVERKKYGQRKARALKQFSKR